jgi:hypothetical protein
MYIILAAYEKPSKLISQFYFVKPWAELCQGLTRLLLHSKLLKIPSCIYNFISNNYKNKKVGCFPLRKIKVLRYEEEKLAVALAELVKHKNYIEFNQRGIVRYILFCSIGRYGKTTWC